GSSFTLTVNGSNFVSASVVQWNGSARPTTFVSSTQLTAQIQASDIAASGDVAITVFTPPPGGGTSNSAGLTILASHRIGVRPAGSFAEFYDRTTGATFTPRGNNYIRLATLTDRNGNPQLAHSTFAVGLYDQTGAENALAA